MPKKGPTPRRVSDKPWTPFEMTRVVPSSLTGGLDRMYQNSRYVVIVNVVEDDQFPGSTRVHLSIRRHDRGAGPFPWRDLHRIKCELVGSEAEGVELFPAASRCLDGANQRHLLCTAPGVQFPYGFDSGREVADDETMLAAMQKPHNMLWLQSQGISPEQVLTKGQQNPFEDGPDYDLGHGGLIWNLGSA